MISIVLTACISVYATYQYFAKDVSYTKLDGTEISVQEALNELYGKQYKVECIGYRTDNLINPQSSLKLEKTIEHDGTLIVDMAGVEGNNTLSNKWEHYVKVNASNIDPKEGFCNGWNGHYFYIVKVKSGDLINIYSCVKFTSNYNGVSMGAYLVYQQAIIKRQILEK